jgi:hypothetical protein
VQVFDHQEHGLVLRDVQQPQQQGLQGLVALALW